MILKVLVIFCTAAFVLLTVYGGEQKAATSFEETKEMVILRKIGHELLRASLDSHSRVMPLKKISATEYHLYFETEFAISTDSFMSVVNEISLRHGLPADITANIISCRNKEIVYASFIAESPEESIVTCLGRPLPKDCYYLSFISPSKRTTGFSKAWYAGGALLSIVGLFFLFRSRKNKQVPATTATIEEKKDENHLSIGNFQFNFQQQYLRLNGELTPLTIKETKLLQLLAASPNLVVDRATLQKEIWENEGVIVTRSLDMFVSKLRKKLQGDDSLKIVNVHGVGYKLECSQV